MENLAVEGGNRCLSLRPGHTCLAVRFWSEKGIERMKRDMDYNRQVGTCFRCSIDGCMMQSHLDH